MPPLWFWRSRCCVALLSLSLFLYVFALFPPLPSPHQLPGAPPLIHLRSILLSTPGVLGARFSGAGFRGCCVALCWRDQAQAAALSVCERYAAAQPELSASMREGERVLICGTNGGARMLWNKEGA